MYEMNWFAVHTKRFREAVAAAAVGEFGPEVFLPRVKVEASLDAVIKVGSKPLFPSYFFARFNPELELNAVEGARGVLYVVKAGAFPVPVDADVVNEIQLRVEADGLIRLEYRQVRPGDRVSVQAGPFAGMIGQVERELDDRKRVAILVKALWNARVLIEKRWLEAESA